MVVYILTLPTYTLSSRPRRRSVFRIHTSTSLVTDVTPHPAQPQATPRTWLPSLTRRNTVRSPQSSVGTMRWIVISAGNALRSLSMDLSKERVKKRRTSLRLSRRSIKRTRRMNFWSPLSSTGMRVELKVGSVVLVLSTIWQFGLTRWRYFILFQLPLWPYARARIRTRTPR